MTQKQHIYGYRMIASDGSTSPWYFVDFGASSHWVFDLQLKNGALLRYNTKEYQGRFHEWAALREIKVEECSFEFDPDSMTFTKIEEE